MKFRFLLYVIFVISFAACSDNDGVDAFEDIIPFPTDIALHETSESGENLHPAIPFADYAYVVASNFDLAYNSGAVKVIDLKKLDNLIEEDQKRDEPVAAKSFPPEIPTPFSEAIMHNAGVFISNFGGEIQSVKNPEGKGETLFVSVRENNSITPIKILSGGAELNCFLGENKKECFRDESIETGRDDPFGMLLMDVSTFKEPGGTPFLFTTHLRKGEITFWGVNDFLKSGDKTRVEEGNSVVLSRTYGAAEMAYASESGFIYLNSRTRDLGAFNVISVFDPVRAVTAGERSYVDSYIDVSTVVGGDELRGFAVSPDGKRLYTASRRPDALFILDISLRPDGVGPRNRVTAVRPIDKEPSKVKYIDLDGDRDLIAVTCTEGDSIYLLNADTLDIVQIIQEVGDGPFAISVYKRPAFDSDGVSVYIMVSIFEESTLFVMKLDTETLQATPVARIGAIRSRLKDFK